MKRVIFLIFITGFFSLNAQEDDLSKQKNIFFMDEYTLGVKLNTNGWGSNFRRGYAINPKRKKMYEFGFNIVKHPKEYETNTGYLSGSYVYGKLNYCFDLNLGYGQQIVLYDKKEVGTVEVRLLMFGGVDLALLKPIYYEIITSFQPWETITEKYQPSHQPALIDKQSPFLEGIGETTVNPGIYFKIGTSFEHSNNVKSIRSLELGVKTTLYLKKLDLMADIDNPRLVVSMYLGYRLGSIIYKKKTKKSDISF